MLGKLLESVAPDALSALSGLEGLDAGKAAEILPLATGGITDGIMGAVKGGDISGVLGMLNAGESGLAGNSLFDGIKNQVTASILTKIGLPAPIAQLAAGAGLGKLIGGLAGKLGGAGSISEESLKDGLGGNLADLASGLLGDKAGGVMDAAKGLLGGKKLF